METEWSKDFEKHRKEKLAVSFYKYGPASRNFPDNVDALATMEKCIKMYHITKNKEYLCDAANYLMFEYMYPKEDNTFYKDTDSDQSAGVVGMTVKEMEDFKNAY